MIEPLNPRDPKRWHDEVVLLLIAATRIMNVLCVVFLVAALVVFAVAVRR